MMAALGKNLKISCLANACAISLSQAVLNHTQIHEEINNSN